MGNPGNVGELSGFGAGGVGVDRICGSVDYEYRIGKYEVTGAQYTEFLNAVGGVDTYGLYNGFMDFHSSASRIEQYVGNGTVENPYRYRVADDWANRPVNFVSWGDAARFCNWLTNGQPTGFQDAITTEDGSYTLNGAILNADLYAVTRRADARYVIPNEDEWYKAAFYDPDRNRYWEYPTQSDSPPGNALESPDTGNNANYYITDYAAGDPHYITLVGQFEASASPWGTYDQGGNVAEWLEDNEWWHGEVSGRKWFGGHYAGGSAGMWAADRRWNSDAGLETQYDGFRIAEVPEPGTVSLLALAGLAALSRRRYA